MNARSEFTSRRSPGVVGLMKSLDGGVFETTWRFQIASPASNQPALRPTRGSGLGAVIDMSPEGDGAAPGAEDDPPCAQAAVVSTTSAAVSEVCGAVMHRPRGRRGDDSDLIPGPLM